MKRLGLLAFVVVMAVAGLLANCDNKNKGGTSDPTTCQAGYERGPDGVCRPIDGDTDADTDLADLEESVEADDDRDLDLDKETDLDGDLDETEAEEDAVETETEPELEVDPDLDPDLDPDHNPIVDGDLDEQVEQFDPDPDHAPLTCDTDEECGYGRFCNNHYCDSVCSSNDDCDQCCIPERGKCDVCPADEEEIDPDPIQTCTFDTDCPVTKICILGYCEVQCSLEKPCTPPMVCESGDHPHCVNQVDAD